MVVGAAIAGVDGQDTKAYAAPYMTRPKAVQFRLSTKSRVDLNVALEARDAIPLDKGQRGIAIGQPLVFTALVRNVGTLVCRMCVAHGQRLDILDHSRLPLLLPCRSRQGRRCN